MVPVLGETIPDIYIWTGTCLVVNHIQEFYGWPFCRKQWELYLKKRNAENDQNEICSCKKDKPKWGQTAKGMKKYIVANANLLDILLLSSVANGEINSQASIFFLLDINAYKPK